ncbi:MAG: hypothetical protein Barrevirus11_12 [Barrevirus sp.]|uniref:F-box domain-containing protein n=1 Tax=Barrevirus sp. TaxID=2487763 RepID=A0A3G4ZQ97_9VIRU|nr:MAG: hypothetical protein Barrevirus11_12 [Barrevirus sp.]
MLDIVMIKGKYVNNKEMSHLELLPLELFMYISDFLTMFQIFSLVTVNKTIRERITSDERMRNRMPKEINNILCHINVVFDILPSSSPPPPPPYHNNHGVHFSVCPFRTNILKNKTHLSRFSLKENKLCFDDCPAFFQFNKLSTYDLDFVNHNYDLDIKRHYKLNTGSKWLSIMIQFFRLIQWTLSYPEFVNEPEITISNSPIFIDSYNQKECGKGSLKDIHKADAIDIVISGKVLPSSSSHIEGGNNRSFLMFSVQRVNLTYYAKNVLPFYNF